MPIVIAQSGLLIQDELIINKYGIEFLMKLRTSLTIVTQLEMQQKVLCMYRKGMIHDSNKKIPFMQIPRFLLPKIRKMFPDELFINNIPKLPDVDIKGKKTFKLYPNQELMMNELFTNVYNDENSENGLAGCIVKMGTGQGKTFLAAAVIAKLKKKTLVVVHDTAMRDQEFTPVLQKTLDNAVICVKNNDKKISEANIVVMVINTVMNKPLEFFKQFGLIIMDEVHLYCTEKRSRVFWKANSQYVLGMSATPDEKRDQFYKLSFLCMGNVIDVEQLEGYTSGETFKGVVRAINYYAPEEYVHLETNASSGKIMTHKTVEKLLEDPYRDGLIMNVVSELLEDPNNYIYIFCQHRNSILHYYRLIKRRFPVFAPEAYSMMGGISEESYMKAKESGRIILVTYAYGGTGKSIPRMTAAVFASPMRSNWKQITGRILRLGSDTTITRKYIDIIDANTILRFQFYGTKKDRKDAADGVKNRRLSRREVYEERGFDILYEEIQYEDIEPVNENDLDK